MIRSKTRRAFIRWHRRLGVFSACFVLLLSFTGILLNHTDDLKLNEKAVTEPWLLSLYGVRSPNMVSLNTVRADQVVWITAVETRIYLDQDFLYQCGSRFISGFSFGDYLIVACENALVIFDDKNQILDVLNPGFGLPMIIQSAGLCPSGVCIAGQDRVYSLDWETFSWNSSEIKPPAGLKFVEPPDPIRRSIEKQYLGTEITLETLGARYTRWAFFGLRWSNNYGHSGNSLYYPRHYWLCALG